MLTIEIVAVMLVVMGLSHVMWSGTWGDLSMNMLSGRTPAAMGLIGGGIALLLGLMIVLSEPPTDGALVIATAVGWLLIAKGGLWLLLPPLLLHLLPRRASTFATLNVVWGLIAVIAGGVLIWAIYQARLADAPMYIPPP